MMRIGLVLLVLASGACGTSATSPTSPAACKHPTPPKQACQARWCDNPLGVGMPCTKDGGECLANNDPKVTKAILCTAAFSDSDAFCTLPCVDDEDCGKGARCVGDPANPKAGQGCMLTACLTSNDSPDASGNPADASSTTP